VDVFIDGEEVLILRESWSGEEGKREGERCFGFDHAASLVHRWILGRKVMRTPSGFFDFALRASLRMTVLKK